MIDGQGARSLDRLLFECQARGARAVHLDFCKVTSISTLGCNVLARQGRVYEETERKIHVTGLAAEIRAALAEVEAILYESNASETPAPAPRSPPRSPRPLPARLRLPRARTRRRGSRLLPRRRSDPAPAPAPSCRGPRSRWWERRVGAHGSAVAPEVASLQAKLKLKIVEFRNLFEITRALNLALDVDEVLNLFSLSVMGQFGVDRLAIFLSDPAATASCSQAGARIPPGALPGLRRSADCRSGTRRRRRASFRLADIEEVDGTGETIEALRQSGFEWGVALWVRRDLEGILLLGGRGGRRGFQEDERDLLTTLAHQGAVAIANARFHRAQEDRNLGLVRGMMSLIESRDPYAKGNTERVVRYVTAVAKLLNYPRESLKALIYGAVLRDIGMITVSHVILKNPAHLSDDEWALIKQHPTRGAQILEEMNLPKEVVEVVLNHHERWGGEGYPRGIRGTEIPLGSRVVSLVDGYVAMTAERPYRRALPAEKARQVIAENWGTPFDPTIVEVFLQVLDKLEKRTRQRSGTPAPATSDLPSARAELDPLSSGAMIPMESRT